MRGVIVVEILLVLVACGGEACAAGDPTALVKTAPLKVEALAETVTGYGTVGAAPEHIRTLNLPYAARVTRLAVAPGEVVAAGAPLAEVTVSPADSLAFSKASSDLEFAKAELERVQELADQQLATRSQLDQARQKLADARQALALQRRLGTGTEQRTVSAPFAGIVTTVAAAPGDRLQAGAPLLQLARRDRLLALIGIEPEELGRVRPGMPVRLSSVLDQRVAVTGKVGKVFGVVNASTRLVDVAVAMGANLSQRFIPGTRVRGIITVGQQKGYAVPRSAVLSDAAGSYLFLVRGGRARRVAVKTGIESRGMVAVAGPLKKGEPVVVLGNYELHDGMAVREGAR